MSDWLEDGLRVYEVESTTHTRHPVVCVVCAKLARNDVEDITNSDYYHWVNFLFVKGDYQRHGYGSLLLNAVETRLRFKTLRPIRVDSAFRAVRFFKARGYSEVGEPRECVFSGSALFKTLQTMEKLYSNVTEKQGKF
ncbi:uncharacterized protein [Porites lutea]|uniref:uncharacterized protein isoform X1 n=1 Tax=Porites lutea TaxID=51062 RepID=UPI003CC5BB83